MPDKKRVLSCIQPTGHMHFGNYFGAVKNWVDLQEKYECVYGVVDYHAMTMPYDPAKLRQNTWELIFNLMACGVDPDNLFIQSLIPEHAELCWVLNCFTSYGQLSRMPQFKDKSQQVSAYSADGFVSAGLLDYPVLQAADILIYRADFVPVGEDQDEHLQLTRNISQRFNQQLDEEYFVLPETLYTEVPKVMSTADPTRKMSKSAGEKHYINIFENEKRLRKQIRSAVTDTGESADGDMSPGIANLFTLLKAAGKDDQHRQLMADYDQGELRYVELKDAVADALVEISRAFKERKDAILADKKNVKNHIKASSATIRKRAQETLRRVKELAGLMNVRY